MTQILDYISEGKYYIITLILLLALSLWAILYIDSPVDGNKSPVMVVIPKGSTARVVGETLAEKGLVRTQWAFTFIAQSTGSAAHIKPGAYRFTRAMSIRQMLDKLVKGEVAAVWVTIPEGYTARKIAITLARRGLVDEREFMTIAEFGAKDYEKILDIPAQGLEGYLYPDTYLISLQSDAREVVRLMVDNFKAKVAAPYVIDISKIAADGGAESTAEALHRIVIVASMIEREARTDKDRPLVSAVIWNRLRRGMKLDIDATIQYAFGEHRSRLFYRDLEIDSPYNTYTHPGLPPGPISNPGVQAIKAAIYPASVDYLYYVARQDGSHIFSRTLDEHNAAVARVRNGRD